MAEKNIENVLITSDGIRNSLRKYKPLQALSEYVWNGFDAKATKIDIEIDQNILSGAARIVVSDNGYGIERKQLKQKFKPFYQSEKVYDPNIKHSTSHGKNGIGRLTFFAFADSATWFTIYKKDKQRYEYSIDINTSSLEKYLPSDEVLTTKDLGTSVVFSDIVSSEITQQTAKEHLALEFCWFLELNKDKDYSIYINGDRLDYSNLIVSSETLNYEYDSEGPFYKVRYVCWRDKLTEYSKYYYIKTDGVELAKENTTLNNKGDRFYHSVYIESSIFDIFDLSTVNMAQETMGGMYHKKSHEYKYIMHAINSHLYDIRRPFIKKSVSKVVDNLEIESAFPNYDPQNLIDKYKKNQLEDMVSSIYFAQPRLFTQAMNKEQKKTFIRLLDLIMESGEVNSLFNILLEILDMDELERKDLSEILKFTRMSSITKTIKLLKDRYQAVSDLKQLIFDRDLKANEVNHLQKMIEKHYWLFGEQYNLVTAAEPNFEEALRRHTNYLHKEYEDIGIEHPDKLKQMDIFAVRQDVTHQKYHNVVVELKHPNISLGETQLSQVKKYMSVILSNDYFTADNMTWEFYLIGNRFSSNGFIEGEIENNKNHGEPSLVYSIKQCKIYVMRWSELFADFEMRHSHLNEKLMIEQNRLQKTYTAASEVISAQTGNTAIAPPEMAHS